MAKVLVSLDESLLERIDAEARKLGLSRSAYLSRLAARDIGTASGPGRRRSVRQAVARLDRLFAQSTRGAKDSTAEIRRERDAR